MDKKKIVNFLSHCDPTMMGMRMLCMHTLISTKAEPLTGERQPKYTKGRPLPKLAQRYSEMQVLESKTISNGTARAPHETSMEDLLLRVAEGDRDAFRRVFDYFAPRLKAYVNSQGSDLTSAEEIVQEALVKVWRKAGQFDPKVAAASTWIFTIARNLRIDHLRKANRPEPDMTDPAFVPDPEALPSENLSRTEEAKILHSAIKKLTLEQQDVLRLAYFEEKSHPEIATALNIPIGTVKSRVRLALKNIRSKMEDTL